MPLLSPEMQHALLEDTMKLQAMGVPVSTPVFLGGDFEPDDLGFSEAFETVDEHSAYMEDTSF